MDDQMKPASSPWASQPTAKMKNAVQRSVTALLDELAPERVLKRVSQLPGPVEQHRTPSGCVLQAATAAISVSWFADPSDDAKLGELRIIVWRGTVAQRGGAPRNRKGATVVAEHVLHPIEPPQNDLVWQATDGAKYDLASLAAKCLALLEEQISLNEAAGPPPAPER